MDKNKVTWASGAVEYLTDTEIEQRLHKMSASEDISIPGLIDQAFRKRIPINRTGKRRTVPLFEAVIIQIINQLHSGKKPRKAASVLKKYRRSYPTPHVEKKRELIIIQRPVVIDDEFELPDPFKRHGS